MEKHTKEEGKHAIQTILEKAMTKWTHILLKPRKVDQVDGQPGWPFWVDWSTGWLQNLHVDSWYPSGSTL